MSPEAFTAGAAQRGLGGAGALEWAEERVCFEAAVALDAGAEALEGLSRAAWWLDDAEVLFETRERAFVLYRRHGDRRSAARMAHANTPRDPSVSRFQSTFGQRRHSVMSY